MHSLLGLILLSAAAPAYGMPWEPLLGPQSRAGAWGARTGSQGAGAGPGAQLVRAHEAFAAADRDGDGVLDAAEIQAARIPARDGAVHDADVDGRLSPDEFLVYFHRLLVQAGHAVEPELERAVRAVRAGRLAEAERLRSARLLALQEARERAEATGIWGRGRATAEARRRLHEARDELAARPPRKAWGARDPALATLPPPAVEPACLAAARARLDEARGLLEDREARIASVRRRMEAQLGEASPEPGGVAEGAGAPAVEEGALPGAIGAIPPAGGAASGGGTAASGPSAEGPSAEGPSAEGPAPAAGPGPPAAPASAARAVAGGRGRVEPAAGEPDAPPPEPATKGPRVDSGERRDP